MGSIAENLQLVREQIRSSVLASGRPEGSVRLLAVSKTHGPEKVLEAWQAGQREFGENYVQEALQKMQTVAAQLPAGEKPVWHFIGPIQSNKTRDIAEHFDWVHSVDRLKIATRLSEQRPAELPPLNVCLQVNISEESSKSGVTLSEAENLCNELDNLPGIRLRGLMAIPAPEQDHDQQRQVYRPLAELFSRLQKRHAGIDTLSTGMSGDYSAAIMEGSTIVRVGTALFGSRV